MILLLEPDYPLARKLIREVMLQRHEAVWSQTPADAARLLEKESFVAAVLAFPALDPEILQLLQDLRRTHPQMPALALLEPDTPLGRHQARLAGASACMVKPFTHLVFRTQLRALLAQCPGGADMPESKRTAPWRRPARA